MTEASEPAPSDSESIRILLRSLARPHRSGGRVIERASLLSHGGEDFHAALAWIAEHGGQPEAPPSARGGGLHGERYAVKQADRTPARFILPVGALEPDAAQSV